MVRIKNISVIIGFQMLVSLSVFFFRNIKINKISCISQYGKCNSLIFDGVTAFQGQSYLEAKKNLNGYLKKNPFIIDHRINYLYPDKIIVSISENKPKYALKYSDNTYALMSKAGLVLKYDSETSLPVLVQTSEKSKYEVSSKVDETDLFALKIVFYLSSLYKINTSTIGPDGLMVDLSEYPRLIFPIEGDTRVLLGSANFILSQINTINNKSDNKKFEVVDLRFKNPVLR